MLLSRLTPLTTTAMVLLGSSLASAQSPMDPSHSIKRDNSIAASYGDINDLGFTPRIHPRSIFEKRQNCGSSSDNICTQTGNIIRCCPSDYDCFYANGDWRCDPNVLGLTRGQKIGIGIGVTVAFFVLCIIALVVFCCCCRKAAQIASAAVNNSNNNNNNAPGAFPPQGQPMVYGHVGGQPGYDPAAIPLTQVGQEGKPYADNTGYYAPPPQQGGYDQYGQQQYAPPPAQQPYQPTTTPAPPYQQPPPHGQYHQ